MELLLSVAKLADDLAWDAVLLNKTPDLKILYQSWQVLARALLSQVEFVTQGLQHFLVRRQEHSLQLFVLVLDDLRERSVIRAARTSRKRLPRGGRIVG
jgi:hypothetical protein